MMKQKTVVTAVLIVFTFTLIKCDTWKLFKKDENTDGKMCKDSDSVFSKIQIFDKSACLLECANHSDCKSVFHGQYNGDCIGCIDSFDISIQPAGLAEHFDYYWQSCPDGWSKFDNSCYLITETRMNFLEGVATCQLLNARAVMIETEEENNFLKALILSKVTYTDDENAVFTGFTDMVTENTWVEYGTSNQMTFQDWASGEPNLGTQENCLALYYPFNLLWVDVPCSWELRMICEKEI